MVEPRIVVVSHKTAMNERIHADCTRFSNFVFGNAIKRNGSMRFKKRPTFVVSIPVPLSADRRRAILPALALSCERAFVASSGGANATTAASTDAHRSADLARA